MLIGCVLIGCAGAKFTLAVVPESSNASMTSALRWTKQPVFWRRLLWTSNIWNGNPVTRPDRDPSVSGCISTNLIAHIVCFVLSMSSATLQAPLPSPWTRSMWGKRADLRQQWLALQNPHLPPLKHVWHFDTLDALPAWLCIVALPAAKSCFCNNFLLELQSCRQDPKYLLAIAGGVAAIGVIAKLPCLQYRVGRHHYIETLHFNNLLQLFRPPSHMSQTVEEILHQLGQLTVYK